MRHRGFSHIGLSTLNLDKTREFYEGVLGFKPVVADTINVKEGGHLRHLFFDVGRDRLIAFLEPNGVPDVPAKYDAGINRGLGVPAGFYHFAFEAGSPAALAEKRDELRAKGVETTDIVDHGWAQSIYFKDPNGLSLEYCCMVRNLNQGRCDDAAAFHDSARGVGTQRHTQRQSARGASDPRHAQGLIIAHRQNPNGRTGWTRYFQ
jgi:catechol 2,3-dioxygenase-like lactoylglutathione lyase family enzyme